MKMSATLLLNNSYEPISIINWQKAMVLLAKGVVELVETYEDKFISTISTKFPMPSVIRLLKWVKTRDKHVRFSRDNVYQRDKGCCQYCGNQTPRNNFTYDHVIPRAMGGKTEWTNIVISCIKCNQRKGGRTPKQANMVLLKEPVKPMRPGGGGMFMLEFQKGMPENWRSFLRDVAYWHSNLTES